ncbi:hypothetical protein EV198_3543 [Roseivirga ehrenbergii]|uniref:Outer membrane protein beta-barrel domain-containing protein n=1 Tax=Roseivirga ehrenbergii (strain DSM 102268 / JCM 13514 / KCTC 12282 / NCIMB 14502 / KMM 6017) TaxID=279360 RepID=A0A150WXF5_ROSEK|nr:hypothetical protein [Roseivirga ehrenbergii]KYG71185.1 hypothetical protein MB14_12160 [Roseivirga ehrenbergii]TCK99016.1 hypothetical protein EV198_3543 [Roseivirga ehrenbergii]
MKKLFIILSLCFGLSLQAQYSFTTVVNTPLTPSVNIVISNLGNGSPINQIRSLVVYDSIKNSINFYSNGKPVLLNSPDAQVKTRFQNNAIQVELTKVSKSDLVLLQNLGSNVYLSSNSDISLTLNSGSLVIPKTSLEAQSLGKILITDDLMETYFGAFGGEYAYANNSFNWSFTPKSESDINKMELNADFSFHQSYHLSKGKAGNEKPLVFYAKGRVSTNAKDSLNYLYIYPLNFDISGASEAQMMARFGVEGNQAFTNGRMAFNFSYEKLIGNLVDFTYGSNRLRLKPVLNIGGKVYKEFDNMRVGAESSNELSGQVFANLYYNIPVFDNYSIIIESNTYYDFSEAINPDQKLKINYSIALGVDIPKSPFKTLFKYKDGQVDVNNFSDSNLTIGLLADLESVLGSGK